MKPEILGGSKGRAEQVPNVCMTMMDRADGNREYW